LVIGILGIDLPAGRSLAAPAVASRGGWGEGWIFDIGILDLVMGG